MRPFVVAAMLGAISAPALAQALTPEQDSQASALADEIVVVAHRLPTGSPESAYEAQFAALFANSQYGCTVVRAAITRVSRAPNLATVALRRVSTTLDACGGGTAAIGGGPLASAGSPGFAIGGSDYTP
jgi:outer membrane receptor for monomeric catechols